MKPLFNSRDSRYRVPFGAVAEGTAVLFRLSLPREWHCHAAHLLRCEDNGLTKWDGMFWAGMDGDDREWWDCHYTPEQAGLYWYGFAVDSDRGREYLTCCPDGTAALFREAGAMWQLTCYEKGFITPDWLAGGVMYQVFPDRFARSGEEKTGVPADRVRREVWGEQPHWRPDAAGIVRNNDFFGGDLCGIREKLPYLKRLGVTCLYLNPIFESHSNHRYDTADYSHIDPMLGTEEDLRELAVAADKLGIRLMLDGVFSHTGADSVYFNRHGRYPSMGAYQSPDSPYAGWYRFSRWPDSYAGWWGFPTLPEVEELDDTFLSYINGKDGIVAKWLNAGASGWRLDVADELPDAFLDSLRQRVKATDPEAIVLGEVWEDASNKHSYGHRRRYLLGRQLDSVMNYPFREAILDVLRDGNTARFFERVCAVVENYPPQVTRLLMNLLGTHDTERAITLLAGEPSHGRGRSWQAEQRLTAEQRERGGRMLRAASVLQYCLPGVPCIYYGDETGMEGYRDPFNRGCYPWGAQNKELIAWFEQLGAMRAQCPVLREGTFHPLPSPDGTILFERRDGDDSLLCAVNCRDCETTLTLPTGDWRTVVGERKPDFGTLCLPAFGGSVFICKKSEKTQKRC